MARSNITTVLDNDLVWEYNNRFRDTVLSVTIFFGIEMMFGFFGNLLIIYVFLFHYKLCNFRYFVLGLALTDLISCITTIPGEMVSQMFWYAYPYPAVCKTKAFFNQFTVCSEATVMTLIAVDRYRKVCHPFGWQVTHTIAIYLCIGAFVISSMVSAPTAVFWGVHNDVILYKGRNITVTLCEKDELYMYTLLPMANIAINGCLACMAMICMLVLYVLVARRLLVAGNMKKLHYLQSSTSTISVITSNSDVLSTTIVSSSENFPDFKLDTSVTKNVSNEGRVSKNSRSGTMRRRRKAIIGIYMTAIFIITTIMYFVLIAMVAIGILKDLNGSSTAVFFFFLRLYFINHMINPILHGILDPQFRTAMSNMKFKVIKYWCFC